MALYRSTLPNYYSDKGGSYVTVGAIVPTLVGLNSDRTNGLVTQDPEYDYRGYLYCDGAEYDIKDYPTLYEKLGNEYNKTTDVNRNATVFTAAGAPGTIRRMFVDSGNVYIEVYGEARTNPDGTTYYDRVIPNDANLSILDLMSFPGGRTWYKTRSPYASTWNNFMQNYSVWVSTNDSAVGQAWNFGGTVNVPSTGSYKIQVASDNSCTITFNGGTYNQAGFNDGSMQTYDLGTVAAGNYQLTFSATNNPSADGDDSWSNNPAGIAIKIYNSNDGAEIWSTRDDVAGSATANTLAEGQFYLLNYTAADQSLAIGSDTHVYRVLINYNPLTGTGGTPGGTVTWPIVSSSLLNDGSEYPILPVSFAGTVPEIDPNTYDPLTGTGYPTGYDNYVGAENNTPALSWGTMVGLPDGISVDSYELMMEDMSANGDEPPTDAFPQWWVSDIPASFTSIPSNGTWPEGVTINQNQVQGTSLGTSPDWVNNGYSGPQPPSGEKHIYRVHVKANLSNGSYIVSNLDFTFGDGPQAQIPITKQPYYEEDLDVEGTGSGITNPNLNIDFTQFATQNPDAGTGHPTVRIAKAFRLEDYPYILGKFRVPDYRDRKLIGFGEGVSGAGTPLVEGRVSMNIGDVGGRWYITTDIIDEPGEFFEISDVTTTGYSDVTTQIEPYLIGEKKYVVGPIQDYIFNKAPTHDHQLLHSVPEESTEAPIGGMDNYTSAFSRIKGSVMQFIPGGESGDGIAKGHSHGLLGDRPSNARIATYGNTDGIGERKPSNALPDVTFAITDALTAGSGIEAVDLNDTYYLNWGSGTGEVGGFANPGLAQAQYLSMSSYGLSPEDYLQYNRFAIFKMDLTGYAKMSILAIAGNDTNGGERINNPGEGLRLIWPNGSEISLLPSRRDTSFNVDQWDAEYAFWKSTVVEIPEAYRTSDVEIRFQQNSATTSNSPSEYREAGMDAAHPNGYDAVGIAQIGLIEGSDSGSTWDGCYNYSITEAPAIEIASWSADGTQMNIVAVSDHGLKPGDSVVVFGTGDSNADGIYEVEESGYTATSLRVLTTANGGGTSGLIREAAGYFQDQTYTPTPRMYTVDQNTVIGGKLIPAVNVGKGEVRYNNSYTPGTYTIGALARTSSFQVDMYAGGGGGGGSTGSGGNGGNTSITFFVDGVSYTITCTGGQGGGSGNGGGSGGQGGTVTIPAALINDNRFQFNIDDNRDGQSAANGGNGGQGAGGGSGGGDGGNSVTIITGSETRTFYNSGSFNANSVVPSGGSITSVTLAASGAAGGDGNPNGNSGCSAAGGSRGSGRYIQGKINAGGTFSHQIGTQGARGWNYYTGKQTEPWNYGGGSGAGVGGAGGRGAWGNGATGGAGGGTTSISNGSGYLLGAGGGGGGGGSGGGYNGGSITDPCWTGGSGVPHPSGYYGANSIGPGAGGQGGIAGCTAGGGGGGGGGFGPSGGGGGGLGGQAGAGHVNTGSGDGGQAGRCAARTSVISDVYETSGSSAGGYVTYVVNYNGTVDNPAGGGGGGGAALSFGFAVNDYLNEDISTSFVINVGGAGNAGSGEGGAAENGFVQIEAFEIVATEVGNDELTSPSGRYYEVPGLPSDAPDFPDTFFNQGIFIGASANVDVKTSTGSNFPLATTKSDGKANRYIEFAGYNNRYLEIGPMNLENVNQMIFTVITGNNSNGGETPEENLMLYYRNSEDSPTENLIEAVALGGNGAAGYVNYIIDLDEENDARKNGVILVLRQDRPENAGDNDLVPDGKTNDNYGLAQLGLVYDEVTEQVFVPSSDATLPGNEGTCGPDTGINVIRRTVSATASNIRFTDGLLTLTGSTPISVTADARVLEPIPLLTRYHRSKYLIKAF